MGDGAPVAVVVMMALAATVWVAGSRTKPQTDVSSSGSSESGSAPQSDTVPQPSARPAEPVAIAGTDRQPNPSDDDGGARPSTVKTHASGSATPRVGRRPGESLDAWRSRGAALQMRYEYSTAALTRGDFAAAAGGFEAILLEEPGFLDAAGLLVQSQAGVRSSARRLFDSGQKLEAAGDWVGALQKYEQARQIYAGVDGLSGRLQQVRKKLHAAGTSLQGGAETRSQGPHEDALKLTRGVRGASDTQ